MADQKNMLQRFNTFKSILNLVEEKEATEKFPALIPIGKSLRKKVDKIGSLSWLPAQHTVKYSERKKKLRKCLAKYAYSVNCGIYAYAQVTRNIAMSNALKYSYSDFYRPVESTMIGRVRQVLNAVKKVKTPEDYGLFPQVIEILQQELKKYIEFMPQPMAQVKQHARTYRNVEKLLDQCLIIVQMQLDPLMIIISCTDDSLPSKYYVRRRIEKPAGRKRKYVKKKKTEQSLAPTQPLHEKVISESIKQEQPFTQIISETV